MVYISEVLMFLNLCDLRFLLTIGSSFLSEGLTKIISLSIECSSKGTKDYEIKVRPMIITKSTPKIRKKKKSMS